MVSSRNIALSVLIYVVAFLVFHLGANAQETPTTTPNPAVSAPEPVKTSTAPGGAIVAPTTAAATATPAPTAAPAAKAAPAADAKTTTIVNVGPHNTPVKKERKFSKMFVKFETSAGNFTAKLFHNQAPKTVKNFVDLAEGTKEWMDPKTQGMIKSKFYDGLVFHRVIKGFVIQGGDPLGLDPRRAGTGGPGFSIPEEFHTDLRFDKPGMLAMAKGNEISGSQFFVTLAPQERLDQPKPTYPIFGEITEGMDVVLKIGAVATDRRNDRPIDAVVIKKVTIIRQ